MSTSAGWAGMLIFILIVTVRPVTLLPVSIFTIVGGFLFGFPAGALLSYFGMLLSATLAFLLAKYAEYRLLRKRLKQTKIPILEAYPFESILGLHLTMLPFDLINYGAGLRRIPFRYFLPAVAIGMLPGTISLTLLGASVDANSLQTGEFTKIDIDWRYILLAAGIFLVTLSCSFLYRRIAHYSTAARK